MPATHAGEIAALATAVSWSAAALLFERATKRSDTFGVNLLKLPAGLALLALAALATSGVIFPVDAPSAGVAWLAVSGLLGFVASDLFLFQAFFLVGARVAFVVLSLVPVFAALFGWLFLHEALSATVFLGMALAVGGILLVYAERGKLAGNGAPHPHLARGVLCALFAALGQAGGLVLSKLGMATGIEALPATQLRVAAGLVGMLAVVTLLGRWRKTIAPFRADRGALGLVAAGAVFGPFVGVTLSLYAVGHAQVGVASTLMALTPVLIIPPAVIFFKERVTALEILGAALAVGGAAVLFLGK